MATLVDVTGAEYPAHRNGHAVSAMEGTSLRPAFHNEPLKRDALYWEHEGNAAVRRGEWKLVRLGGRGPWELYDLKSDRTEQHDLADEKPELAAQLAAKWNAWAERCNASRNGQPKKQKHGPRNNATGRNRKKARP